MIAAIFVLTTAAVLQLRTLAAAHDMAVDLERKPGGGYRIVISYTLIIRREKNW